jgi:pilus assembly protein Flp/PilA
MRLKLQQFLHDESGASAIEFGLIAAGLCVAIITLAGHMNDEVRIGFERLRDLLRSFNLHAIT